MHKGSAGKVLIVGGSPGLAGAVQLAGTAALRAGSGLVTVGCPRALEPVVKAGLPDLMTLPLGSGELLTPQAAPELEAEAGRFDAMGVGPGLGRAKASGDFMEALADCAAADRLPPLVLDADALYWLAERPELMERLPEKTVLTPHPGEMARLLQTSVQDAAARRLEAARSLARKHRLVVALKGAGTVVAAPDESVFLSPFCEPNLAVGGSGDVLTGAVTSLLGRGLTPLSAALAAVYWHGLAGRRLSENYPARGNLAGDIATALPRVLKETLYGHDRQGHHDPQPHHPDA
jgi:NAD(P)H-hydrate epimerase